MKKERKKTFGLYLGIIFLALLFSFTGCKSREAEFLAGEENVSEEALPEEEETPGEEAPEATVPPRKIFVDVCGAVANPGVYELDADSRVFHAIDAAGGFLKEAASEYVNRAKSISDGEQVYIPTREEVQQQSLPALSGAGVNDQADAKVNLNTADKEQLMTLSGIGESKAEAILAYREESGGFQTVEDILNVPGIKEGTLAKIKDDIAVE